MNDSQHHAQRRDLRAARNTIPAAQRFAAAERVAEHLFEWRAWQQLGRPLHVAGYWAVGGELSLHALVSRLARHASDFVYHLPCLEAGSTLRFAPWRFGDAIAPNRYGIPEPTLEASSRLLPEQLDVVLLPLSAFDRRGNRLGSGGGYYDRSFAFRHDSASKQPLLMGVAYAMQELPQIDAETWDVALDAVVTENGLIDCIAERQSGSK